MQGDERILLFGARHWRANRQLHSNAGADRTIDVSKFKDIAGVSRKYAILCLSI